MTEQSKADKKWRKTAGADLKRMCPQHKARYLAYTEPSKETKRWMEASRQRICAHVAQERREREKHPFPDSDKLRQDTLVGQLKAAEARNRIRHMRLRYQNLRAQEISLMVMSQPSPQSSLCLKQLLPAKEETVKVMDKLDQLQKRRVEEILDDDKGLTILRR